MACRYMDHTVVLNIGIFLHDNWGFVAAKHCTIPDAGAFFEGNISEHRCISGDKCSFLSHAGGFAIHRYKAPFRPV